MNSKVVAMVRWHKLTELARNNFKGVPKRPGVYFIRVPRPIGRLGSQDRCGILYIGEAASLRARIKAFWDSITLKSKIRHTAAKTYMICRVYEVAKPEELEVEWVELESKEKANTQEWAAFNFYAKKFKEPPPLNLELRRETFARAGLSKVGISHVAPKPTPKIKEILNEVGTF